MHFGVVEKTFLGYGAVIALGALGFIGARYRIYENRDEVLAARERIYSSVSQSREYEASFPLYTEEVKNKFYKELAESKTSASN